MRLSGIPWTDFSGGDANFVSGCTPVSEGCRFCYAKRYCERFGMNFSHIVTSPQKLARLSTAKFTPGRKLWRRDVIRKRGRDIEIVRSRPMCFVVDIGDIFHEDVPDEFIKEAYKVLRARTDVDWQILTKRPERIPALFDVLGDPHFLPAAPNVWIGISVEDQRAWDTRWPELWKAWPGLKFVSFEPLLGPIILNNGNTLPAGEESLRDLGWAIVGGESGPHHRPFDPEWAERIHDFCWDEGIPFFGKQVSATRPGAPLLIRGRECHEFPGEEP